MIKTIQHNHAFPAQDSHPSANCFGNTWESMAIRRLILQNSFSGRRPAFLFLGRVETELLREHLGDAFGAASVITLHDTYYMGLKVMTVDEEQYVAVGGSKRTSEYSEACMRLAS
jgi:hypothetical protein